MNRRDFIQTASLATSGLLLSFFLPVKSQVRALSAPGFSPHALLRIDSDDTVRIILHKVEMGQGIWTTLPMLIAEELDCDWTRIRVENRVIEGPQQEESMWVLSTGGSDTTRSEFDRLRTVGAIARTMLVQAAAKRLGISPGQCSTANGYVLAGTTQISYGSLATEASALPIPTVKLRDPREWKLIGGRSRGGRPRGGRSRGGRSPQRLDIPDKVNGRTCYGIDIQFPGLLVAVLERCPVFGGKVKSFNASDAVRVPGVRKVVQVAGGVAVVADHTWAALQGRKALQIEWDLAGVKNPDSSKLTEEYRQVAQQSGMIGQSKGNVDNAWQKADTVYEQEFQFPYLAHAPMETLNCTVKLTSDRCEIWTATQSQSLHRQDAARILGFSEEQVVLYTPAMGGSFGRRGSFGSDWVTEALHIAKASGENIKLIWTREDDIRGGYYRPVYLHQAKIGIGINGLPIAWKHDVVGQSLFVNTVLEKDIAPNGLDYSSLDGVNGSPYLTHCADHAVVLHTTANNVPVLAWRSVGNTHTAFVMETLIDELAFRAGRDAVEYRKTLLTNHPRHLAALNTVAEKAGWGQPLPQGHFQGVAVHAAMGSVVAQVFEISFLENSLKVHRVVCVIACGLAVNPDGIAAQMEGGIIYGLTAALYGEITVGSEGITQSNFHDYRMLRIEDSPEIEVHIIEDDGKMGGAGEPGVAPVAPALGNAFFAATGKRIRKLPLLSNIS
ncbi:molybdopterin-dependent oxidoreductase [Dyadobacter sp. CY261]|uniref:xanthine dehydrogenase family protein molybdopterin-binding subunit n=1 Tax=Dyadobacter sp. CY261 TaxID=2907203 RepID=UPI001F2E416B|nr:molybdopterin cofactor-binding domain-containing protein [Dyadobacter sp. CY261]MCF0069836.1 molybdopterin-dependent oxidoreductase [Dyadobacter sp. CY261]